VTTPPLRWTSLADDVDGELGDVLRGIERDVPPFLAELTAEHRRSVTESCPQHSWVVAEDVLPVAAVRAVPLRWDGSADDAPSGGAGEAVGRTPEDGADTLAVLDLTVAYGARGRGVGAAVLDELDARREACGFARTLILLRPHAKAAYPLIPFARYLSFMTPGEEPFDPWLRAAWRAGYVPVLGVERSLNASADLPSWQRWLDVAVPGSGPYLVEGAIKPAIVELELGEGRYREPHLWVGSGDGVVRGRDGWVASLGRAGVVAGDRAHREPKRRG
jgi:hypothetical protein